MDQNDSSLLSKKINCIICRAEITNIDEAYQLPQGFGLVCQKCIDLFSSDDISLIAYLFFIYGGYFGKYDEHTFSIFKVVENISNLTSTKKDISLEDINEHLVHKALLHGISPQRFIDLLRSFSFD